MYKDKFDELWNKTVDNVLFVISAKDIKGKAQINEFLHRTVWDHAWGNEKLVPPERKLLNDLSKENPKKAMKIKAVLSDISVGNGVSLYAGIVAALAGIIILFVTRGVWRFVGGAVSLVGIGVALSDALQCTLNPKKAALQALEKAKKECDEILH